MDSVLLTDLYELTMLEAYFAERMAGEAVFELFVRKLPPERNFLLAAGLADVVDYLTQLAFADGDLAWMRASGRFSDAFVDALREFRFSGDVDAMPEGTPFFADEPILRVSAPLPQAQFVESRVLNLMHYETIVASKAVRCVLAAKGKLLVDFGLRRAHAGEAGLLSARASYLAGFDGTATVEGGRRYGIPLYGTMAHSYVQAHDSEMAAFEAFARVHRDNPFLLIDTYDTERAARGVVELFHRLAREGIRIKGVRIDSGDLGALARSVRGILDAGGCQSVKIFASGNLDEHRVKELVDADAPIDGFGVGTRMNTSADAPFLDCAYKLTEYEGRPRRKRSSGNANLPGRKQVFRQWYGEAFSDVVTVASETLEGTPLLVPVMRSGRLAAPLPSLDQSRDRAREQVASLPPRLRALEGGARCDVVVSAALRALTAAADAGHESARAAPRTSRSAPA
jgi:nicotinate phosphoribosyltransferase